MSTLEELKQKEIDRKAANAARSRKYYDSQKEKIAERRKAQREEVKKLRQHNSAVAPVPVIVEEQPVVRRSRRGGAKNTSSVPPTPTPTATPPTPTPTPTPTTPSPQTVKNKFSLANADNVVIPDTSYEAVKEAAKNEWGHILNFKNKKERLNSQLYNINLLFRATNKEPLYGWIQKPDKFAQQLYKLKQLNGNEYSLSGWQKVFGTLMNVIKIMKIPITEEQDEIIKYHELLSRATFTLTGDAEKNIKNIKFSITNYKNVLKKTQKNPEAFLLAKLYESAPLRRDYENIKYFSTTPKTDEKDNYILIPNKGNASVVIYDRRKTRGSGLKKEFPPDVSDLLRNYKNKQKNTKEGVFFPTSTFAATLKKIFPETKAGENATNLIRRSIASTLYDNYKKGQATAQDVFDQSRTMGHNFQTHLADYIYATK